MTESVTKMFIYRSIMILFFCFRNGCLADKKHFAKWIKNDFSEIYIFETLLGKGLDQCIESCKAKKMCEYINFNVNADACFLIGVSSIPESLDTSHNDKIEKKKGYVLGKKKDWNLGKDEFCTQCEAFGECKRDEESDGYTMCQKSGCGPPDSKQYIHTVVYGNMFAVGDKIQYQCQDGYTDVYKDTGIVTCQDSGNWSSTSIKCVPDDLAAKITCCRNNSYYLLVETVQSWQDGKSYCESRGGHLAYIETKDEHEFIKENIFNDERQLGVWIGANNKNDEGTFIWLDGTHVDDGYSAWAMEPSDAAYGNCMIYRTKEYGGEWLHNWQYRLCFKTYTWLGGNDEENEGQMGHVSIVGTQCGTIGSRTVAREKTVLHTYLEHISGTMQFALGNLRFYVNFEYPDIA